MSPSERVYDVIIVDTNQLKYPLNKLLVLKEFAKRGAKVVIPKVVRRELPGATLGKGLSTLTYLDNEFRRQDVRLYYESCPEPSDDIVKEAKSVKCRKKRASEADLKIIALAMRYAEQSERTRVLVLTSDCAIHDILARLCRGNIDVKTLDELCGQ